MLIDVTLPVLGEGIEEAEVIQILVKTGDAVEADQPLIEVETDKATVEVPAPSAGVVGDITVSQGATIKVGAQLLTLTDGAWTAGSQAELAPPEPPAEPEEPTEAPAPKPKPFAETAPLPAPVAPTPVASPAPPSPTLSERRALAAPSVRKLAREIGVDIETVTPTGRRNRVTLDDVKAYAKQAMRQLAGVGTGPAAPTPLPDFAVWGPVEKQPLKGIRRTVTRRMSQAWQTVPHVTQHDQADISEFEAVRKTTKKHTPDLPLTVTALAVAVAAAALREFPQFNASLDVAGGEIVYKQYVHIGVAVDTERGLLVPVIRDADTKSLGALSTEISALASKVREGKAEPDDLQGGTFTITNLGGLGGTAFTPIVNYPEVAILGLSRSTQAPVWTNDRFEPRPIMPLSLSYDHRLIDGADGVRFLRWIATRLEHPLLLEL